MSPLRTGAVLLMAVLALGQGGCSSYAPEPEVTHHAAALPASTLYAPHRDDSGTFFIPWAEDPKTVGRLLRWYLFTRNPYDKFRSPEIEVVENDGAYLAQAAAAPSVTWIGHSSFAVHDGEDVFLTDPHFTKRALIPARHTPPGVPVESIPGDAFAVISHNHYDHLDASTVTLLPETVQWFVPLGMADWFRERGRPNVVELDWWESTAHGRWTITCLPSQHWSARIEQGQNEALWCAWLVASEKRRYFFAGDTGYFHGFREFGRKYPDIDVAMMPIGAYEPRWFMRFQHMNPAEAHQAFLDLGARAMLSMHWGTFDLTDEPVDRPPIELDEVLRAYGGDDRVHTLAVGERWMVPTAR